MVECSQVTCKKRSKRRLLDTVCCRRFYFSKNDASAFSPNSPAKREAVHIIQGRRPFSRDMHITCEVSPLFAYYMRVNFQKSDRVLATLFFPSVPGNVDQRFRGAR